ncbi:MAG: bifunctional methylenetetrahydrofolate dehydrogenase/methenyltetrahydrofolate cyclohydrolase FolD [Chlorobiaceae bacterium]|nr:bifunctional methylenetetrahydrofolate dehydrogenase/methenyltetrahydrofolate cyclohydrolase FolD [Chlorobiaceae bacterium]NTW73834.1 bifunctional methylenetetrahydrofolate dehydrogenase/methenyltetrahydrofolate cyclohydrolase FolD [Chlorobiaceae bacterium]
MVLIDGKKVSADLQEELSATIRHDRSITGKLPGLTIILVGQDPSSQVYVRNKAKRCKEIGMNSTVIELPDETTLEEILERIALLNADPETHGILVQQPLPPHIDEMSVTLAIDPEKDVDGFHPENIGKMVLGHFESCHISCTAYGILELLGRYGIETSGRHCVIVGRSNIVGKPMANLMLQKLDSANCTVTVCHSASKEIATLTRLADILIVAVGKPGFITAGMVKPGAVVIDVGNNRIGDASTKSGFRYVGDVDFDGVSTVASAITPVPGGVGPMTIAMLMKNTVNSFHRSNGL